jgi:hypothetical protein
LRIGAEIPSSGRRTRSQGPPKFALMSLQDKIFEVIVARFVERVLDETDDDGDLFDGDDGFSSEGKKLSFFVFLSFLSLSVEDDMNMEEFNQDLDIEFNHLGKNKFLNNLESLLRMVIEGKKKKKKKKSRSFQQSSSFYLFPEDDDDAEDPDFKNDPINKIDFLKHVRTFLYDLMKMNVPAFEARVGRIGDMDARNGFMRIWGQQLHLHLKQ